MVALDSSAPAEGSAGFITTCPERIDNVWVQQGQSKQLEHLKKNFMWFKCSYKLFRVI